MREPGGKLLRLSCWFGANRLRDTVIAPAVTDMRHEYARARSSRDRAWVLARGYWSLVAGSSFYAIFLPARYLRENWAGVDAPGTRLLKRAAPAAAALTAFYLCVLMTSLPSQSWKLGASTVALLFPSMIVQLAPQALALAVGWTLARDGSGSRATLGIGLLGALLTFAFLDQAVTRANQEYRVASYRIATGRTTELRKGSREMTLKELEGAAALATAEGCSQGGGMSGCSGSASPMRLQVEWHKRLSLPALCVSLMLLSTGLARTGRRVIVVLGFQLCVALGGRAMALGERYGYEGQIPVILAAWGAHLLPLTVACIFHMQANLRHLRRRAA